MTEIGKALPIPSSLTIPYRFSQIVGPDHSIACNRPFEYNALPLVLLHEAFGIFEDRCKAAPSERALAFLNELTAKVCEWYQEETQCWSAIRSVFQWHLGVQFQEEKVPNTEFTSSSVLQGPARLKSPGLGSAWEGSGSQKSGAGPWSTARARLGWAQA